MHISVVHFNFIDNASRLIPMNESNSLPIKINSGLLYTILLS